MNHHSINIPIVKQINSDFVVREVSLYPKEITQTLMPGFHTIVMLSKEGYTTFEAMHELANFFHIPLDTIHCEGLKDEDGVTTQLVSLHSIVSDTAMHNFSDSHAHIDKGWIKCEIVGYAPLPVMEKKLHANVFSLTVRRLSQVQADLVYEYCARNADFICANYYDQQRFGLPGGPYLSHEIGKAVVHQDWVRANELYTVSGNPTVDRHGVDMGEMFDIRQIDARKLQFFVSAYSSSLWNKKLSDALNGDLQIEIFKDFTVTMLSDATIPIPLLIEDIGYMIDETWQITERPKKRASTITTTIYCSSPTADDLNDKSYKLVLDFSLSTGSYATMAVKQLMRHCAIQDLQIGSA